MQRSLRLSFSLSGAAAFALTYGVPLHANAQEAGSAEDLGVMEINFKDAVQFNWGFLGALQGAGTPNQAGIGGFLPIAVGENSVFFADVLLNANFAAQNHSGNSATFTTEDDGPLDDGQSHACDRPDPAGSEGATAAPGCISVSQ